MNPWSNHTTAMAQHREYEARYGSSSPTYQSNRRLPSAFTLLAVLTTLCGMILVF